MTTRPRLNTLIPAMIACTLAACSESSISQPAANTPFDASAEAETSTPDAAGDTSSAGDGETAAQATDRCVNHTQDDPHCKDCCDCASVACTEFTPCRNACKTHDFSTNTDFIEVTVPSVLGPGGDYSACVAANADPQTCKVCCECTAGLVCGDFQFCRTLCDNAYDGGTTNPPPVFGAPQLIQGGFVFTEGPVWNPQTKTLLFSDIDANTIYQLTPPSTVSTFRTPSNRSNGLALDNNGLLLAAEYTSRSITRTLANGTIQTVVDRYEGKRFNSPNDLVVRSDGTLYFTDPSFGLQGTSEIGFQGLYRLSLADALTVEAQSDQSPNGVNLSPDEKTLYLALTFQNEIMAYNVGADGATSHPRTFATVEQPDGMCVAPSGRVYVAAKDNGVGALVVLDASGVRLASLPIAEGPTNCEIGGDGATSALVVTTRVGLYRVEMPVGGF